MVCLIPFIQSNNLTIICIYILRHLISMQVVLLAILDQIYHSYNTMMMCWWYLKCYMDPLVWWRCPYDAGNITCMLIRYYRMQYNISDLYPCDCLIVWLFECPETYNFSFCNMFALETFSSSSSSSITFNNGDCILKICAWDNKWCSIGSNRHRYTTIISC